MSAEPRITIAGAGLAGPLAALLLARRGWRVTLIERRSDPRRSEALGGRSINLALAARGLKALTAAGLEAEVAPLLIPMRGRRIHQRDGSGELLPYGQREHEVIYSVSRAELNRLLVDTAAATGRVELQFDCAVSDYDPDNGMLEWDDIHGQRQRSEAAPLIATDGAGSVLRRAMQSRGRIETREELLTHAYKELTIAPATDGTHRLEREALHIWPRGGFMLIALPNLDGSFTVTLFLSRGGTPSFASLTDADSVERFFANEFGNAAPLIEHLTDTFFANPTGVLGTVYAEPWHVADKLLLLGDAAHAIVPFHGQGMNAAFEDCRLLAERLTPDAGVGHVFEAFSRDRKADADAIARMALENYVEMRDTVRNPGFALRKALGFELERRCPDRFVPRYSMVMFHHLSYAEVERRGDIQKTLLGELTRDHEQLSTIDLGAAEQMVRERLTPFVHES
ncbi:MAG: FAD-dependent oxidoreductase [Gammaproteobacteria bacterium]